MANKKFRNKRPVRDDYIPPFPEEVLGEPVTSLKLRADTLELLTGAGVRTLCDVLRKEEKDFYRIHTFNKKNLIDVKTALKERGLYIKPTPEKPAEGEKDKPLQQKSESGQNGQKNRQNGNSGSSNAENGNRNGKNKQQQKKDKAREGTNESYVMVTRPPKPPRPKVQPVKEVPDIYVKINRGGKWGFKDRSGKQVVEPVYDEVYNFKEDLCCVELNEKFGFVNRKGEVVIPLEYDCATSFSEGFAAVFRKDKCGYIDVNNSVVADFRFDAGTPVVNGECRVKKDGKWGEMHFIRDADNVVTVGDIRWIT